MSLPQFSAAELAKEADREVKMREHVWRDRLAAGDTTATKRVQMMKVITNVLIEKAEAEKAPTLFG